MEHRNFLRWSGALTAAFLLTLSTGAQPPEPGAPPPGPLGPGPGGHFQILRDADADKDGSLTLDEFLASQKEIFKRLDKNSDGKVDAQERDLARQMIGQRMHTMDGRGPAGPMGPARPGAMGMPGRPGPGPMERGERARIQFGKMDTNTDGKISKEEFKGAPERFDKIDANKDGSLTPEEIRDAVGKGLRQRVGAGLDARFDAWDTNKNGRISQEEFKGRPERFKLMDKDGDKTQQLQSH